MQLPTSESSKIEMQPTYIQTPSESNASEAMSIGSTVSAENSPVKKDIGLQH